MAYNEEYYSHEKLAEALLNSVDPFELNRLLSGYDMAEKGFETTLLEDGSPFFFRTSRIVSILVTELDILKPDILIVALLHELCLLSPDLTCEIIEYNFGRWVSVLLCVIDLEPDQQTAAAGRIWQQETTMPQFPYEELFIVLLAEHLEKFRWLGYDPKFDSIKYIWQVSYKYLPLAERSDNPKIKYLLKELQKERNKILG